MTTWIVWLLAIAGMGGITPLAWADAGDPVVAPGIRIDDDYAAGEAAIRRRDWEAAIRHFSRVTDRPAYSADAYNWIGYATRNLGKYREALTPYHRALEINPRHRGAHEYIGETYLLLDDVPKAEAHLAELRKLCPMMACEELKDLEAAIREYKRRRPSLYPRG